MGATTRACRRVSAVLAPSPLFAGTNVDLIRYGLPFERFLNLERVNPPDIDIDFADDRRASFNASATGNDSVAQIITFGTMGAKSVSARAGSWGLSCMRPPGEDDPVRLNMT